MADDNKAPISSQIYAFLLAIVSMSLTVILYHCVVVHWCNHRRQGQLRGVGQGDHAASSMENSRVELVPSHKYRKGTMGLEGEEGELCPVCLSEFKEGEDLRTLPECVHSFHVACIDMWLYSHSNCPMCRTDATPSPFRVFREAETERRDSMMSQQDLRIISIGV